MYWVDLVIIAVIVIGIWQGFFRGFIAQLFHMVAIIAAILVSFSLFPPIGGWFEHQLQIPVNLARPIALLFLMIILTYVFQFIASILQKLFAPILQANPINRAAGAVLGGLRQAALVSVALALLVSLPVPVSATNAINRSHLSKPLINFSLAIDHYVAKSLGDSTSGFLDYRIVQQSDPTTTALNYTVLSPTVDAAGAAQMLQLTNKVRLVAKANALTSNPQLQQIAEAHAKDMFARGYFSHVTPQGKDALARVQDAKLTVLSVGENLALAPTVDIAQTGLMASEGHRKNILNPDFNQVGIAVLDGGTHGKMIVEEFAKIP